MFKEVFEEEKQPETFDQSVEKGVAEALDLVKKRFGKEAGEDNEMPFHNIEHTQEVIGRTEKILSAVKKADPSLVSERDIQLGKLAAAFHDTVQQWGEVKTQDSGFEKVVRRRFTGINESESGNEAVSFMARTNENEIIFSDEDKTKVQKAIGVTIPDWDKENRTVVQPNLAENSSLVERAVALSDLATAGMDGPEKFTEEGRRLFTEENLDILHAMHKQGTENISADQKEFFRQRMINWLKTQPFFAIGRQARLETELEAMPQKAHDAIIKLFNKFEASIKASKEIAKKAEKMTFEDLAKYMGY